LKKAGMPVHSIEAARDWHAKHQTEGVGHKGTAHPAVAAAAAQLVTRPKPAIGEKPDDANPESTLWRARQSEVASYDLLAAAYDQATKSKNPEHIAIIPGLLRTHAQAARNRLEAERQWERHRMRLGAVVTLEFAQGLIASSLGPLDAQLGNVAKSCAAEANPANPPQAERAITEALNALRRQIADNKSTGLTPEEMRIVHAAKAAGVDLLQLLRAHAPAVLLSLTSAHPQNVPPPTP
jgi:hypothetical protein